MNVKNLTFVLICLSSCLFANAQTWQCFFEQDYYTNEPSANLMILGPNSWIGKQVSVELSGNNFPIIRQNIGLEKESRVLVGLRPVLDSTMVTVRLQKGAEVLEKQVLIRKLAPKINAVKVNRLKGHLVVDDLPFFPLGFYCYSPVQPTLAEEEVVRGFNMMSPYQKIQGATLSERLQYLDRCAALGMKVHYNLLSIAGGGGVGSGRANYAATEKAQLLKQEILAIKDHPALLAWYISDEPTGSKVLPADLDYTYRLIKSLDPYHPISIVFMNPDRALEYSAVMDIVMADPYPIPNRPASEVGPIIERLKTAFQYKKPVWMVPQAFGGNEHWSREPSPQEIRLMTWLPVLKGASGIQYFIRHGLNSFPKSSITWATASQSIKELDNLSSFLLNADKEGTFKTIDRTLEAKWYQKNGQTLLVVLNTLNKPKNFLLNIEDLALPSEAKVLFEDRMINSNQNRLQDIIEAYGRRVYLFSNEPLLSSQEIFSQNLLVDPSFEESLVPGTPAACYFKLRGDRGATAALDTRMAIDGRHSLRLTTPNYNQGLDVSLFPVQLQQGQSYAFTFWAKAKENQAQLIVRLGNGAERIFELVPYWRPYQWVFEAQGNEATRNNKTSVLLSLLSQGTAWLDVVQLAPEPRIEFANSPFDPSTEVRIESALVNDPSISINYTLDGSGPNITSPAYTGPLLVKRPLMIKALVSQGGQRWMAERRVTVNMQKATSVNYQNKYHDKYTAGGTNALIDGQLGSERFTDEQWQGWNKGDIDLTLDYGKAVPIKEIQANFLIDHANWIYPPIAIEVYGSKNGKRFKKIASRNFQLPGFSPVATVQNLSLSGNGEPYQYVRFVAKKATSLPGDHPSSGGNPFIFLDEIMLMR